MRINVFKSGGNSAEGGFVSNGLTLQGPLILSGPHTDHLHAVPKQYVDNATYNLDANNITSGVLAAARLPAFTGDATTILGTSNLILANTGVTPGSIIKPTVDAKGRVVSSGTITEADITAISFDKVTTGRPTTLNGYGITDGVPLSSNTTITGDLIQSADPVMADQVATKHYVDAASGLAGGISVGDIIRKPYTTTPAGFLKCNGGEVDKTTYANLYSVIGDTFLGSSTPGAGKPWEQQYEFNKIQDVDLLGWTEDTSLPSVLTHFSHIVTKNRVYVLGGWTGTTSSATVYTAPIDSSGTIGTWVTGTNLPIAIHGGQAVVAKNRVYLIGGYANSTTPVSTVYSAPIDASGLIGSWVTCPSLPSNLFWSRALVIKNRIYMFGGHNGSMPISTIYTTIINDDGTLNTWSIYGTLPYTAYTGFVFITKNRIYLCGGSNGTVNVVTSCSAIINSDGTLGNWEYIISLPKPMSTGPVIVTNNYVYIIYGTEVWSSKINSDGTLRGWVNTATVPYSMGDTKAVVTNSKIYLISSSANGYVGKVYYTNFLGGSNDYSSYYEGADSAVTSSDYIMSGSGQPWRQQYQINTTQSGDITGWTTATSLPSAISVTQALVTKNRVYLLGGKSGISTAISTVYTAVINTDGTLGTWTTDASLPSVLMGSQVITTKNRVYLLGGHNGTNVVATVYTASINSDGTLGTWVTDTSLPAAINGSQSIVTKNRVYLLGGANSAGTPVSTVYTATIAMDGTLGPWTTASSLPSVIYGATAVVTKNRVYLCCGTTDNLNVSSYTSVVYTACINTDGTLGTWSTSASVPEVLYASQAIVTKNKAYLLGGNTGAADTKNVYAANINSDGTLGAWSLMPTVLLGGVHWSQSVIVANKIYLFGAWNANSGSSTVYTATISGGLNDYSPYYDGTNELVDTTVNYMMPGSGRPWQQQYQINNTQSSDITGWTVSGTTPGPVSASFIVTKNRIYLLGGFINSVSQTKIYSAVINEDGSLGSWILDSNTTPTALNYNQVFAIKTRAFYIYNGAVYNAPINADGTLGTWTTSSSLPASMPNAQCLVTRNRVYVFSSWNGTTASSSVYTSIINNDGTLAGWTTATSLPISLGYSHSFITKNRIYIVGGLSNSAYINSIYSAIINTDGTLGNWILSSTTLPVAIGLGQIFVTANKLYIFGGTNTGYSYLTSVYSAAINADGTIGTWTAGTSLPIGLGGSYCVAVKNKIYLMGGNLYDAVTTTNMYSATISDSLNDYSAYYDGTIQPVSTISSKFKLPDYTQLDREFGEYVTSYIKY